MYPVFIAQDNAANLAGAELKKYPAAAHMPHHKVPYCSADVLYERVSVRSGKMKGHYIRTLCKVTDKAGIVLLVLDPHDTTGAAASRSRCRFEVKDKRLVFVLNKIDPLPHENAQEFSEAPQPRDPFDAFPPGPGPTSALALHQRPPSPLRGVQYKTCGTWRFIVGCR
ncbi:hypothetical protein H4582DRAFT_2061182 [Lactarius indigo]|nr:hypothetical protein H4582DRAFT_2061182 [Lactarius indigo]